MAEDAEEPTPNEANEAPTAVTVDTPEAAPTGRDALLLNAAAVELPRAMGSPYVGDVKYDGNGSVEIRFETKSSAISGTLSSP